jgi:alkaline phosphatase
MNKIFILSVVAYCMLTFPHSTNGQSRTTGRTDKKSPKNIILMIGDGMGTSQVYAGITASKDNLNLERVRYIGFSKTNSSDNYITDSAAGATAFSTGKKTYNGAIGVDANGESQETILETAEKRSLSTGLVATCSITHATPAAFIAHQPSRTLDEDIAADFLKTDIDVFIGGGRKHFAQRADERNLLEELKKKNYQIATTQAQADAVKKGKLAALLADEHLPRMTEGRGDMLAKSTQKAIDLLKQNTKGFFLMVEGSQIDWGGHGNETEYVVREMLDFDEAVGVALDFAEKDGETLVIITADHETGGFALTGGNLETGEVTGGFVTGGHTGVMVPVFAFGPGAEEFIGIYHNTAIYDKMMKSLQLSGGMVREKAMK